MNKRITLLSMVLCLFFGSAVAQISITTGGGLTYTQDFNSLPTSGTLSTNPFPSGWYRYDDPTSVVKDTIKVTTGSTTSGGFYSVGDNASTERAFGILLSGSTDPLYLGAKFTNNTGSTIVSASVTYRCEQWRRGNNVHALGHADSLLVEYNTGSDSVQKGVWTNVSTLMGTSSVTDTTPRALDGNVNFQLKTFTITGLSVPNGGTYWIRFNDVNISGSEDILAVDDFSVTFATGVTVPCTEPPLAVISVVANGVGPTTISGSYGGGAEDGYLVVAYPGGITLPVNGVAYAAGDALGTGKVLYNGQANVYSGSGLTPSTIYNVYVYPYNNFGCSGGPIYKLSTPGNDTAKTKDPVISDCTAPSGVSNSSIKKTDSTMTTISFHFTLPVNADSVMVVAGPNLTIGFVDVRDSMYYGVGSTIPGSQGKVYARGTDTAIVLTGLTSNTVYKILVIAFNNKNCTNGPNYGGVSSTTIKTAAVPAGDCGPPSGVSNTSIQKTDSTATTISFHFTKPAGADSVMVVAGPNLTIGFVDIRDSMYYAVGSTIPGSQGKVYARGTDTSIVLTGLTPNTVYKILIATFNNIGCNHGPNYSGAASTTIKTAVATGVKYKNAEAEFTLYPNPTNNGSIFVKFANSLKEDGIIEVLDIAGRVIGTQKVQTGSLLQTIDVSNYAKGTYLLNVVYKGTNNVSTFLVE